VGTVEILRALLCEEVIGRERFALATRRTAAGSHHEDVRGPGTRGVLEGLSL
jgi:hypothetical protein